MLYYISKYIVKIVEFFLKFFLFPFLRVLWFLWKNCITLSGIITLIFCVVLLVKHIKKIPKLEDATQKKKNKEQILVFALMLISSLYVIYLGWIHGTADYLNI